MGLLTAQLRLAQINNYRSDLEYQINLISSTKISLSAQINDMVGLNADMDPESPESKALEKKKARLQQDEKALDQKLQRYQTQLQMIEAEEQTVKQQVQTGIQRSFAA